MNVIEYFAERRQFGEHANDALDLQHELVAEPANITLVDGRSVPRRKRARSRVTLPRNTTRKIIRGTCNSETRQTTTEALSRYARADSTHSNVS
jgi:hypothetical protein